jgi:uncharacterized protein (DUF362 family)
MLALGAAGRIRATAAPAGQPVVCLVRDSGYVKIGVPPDEQVAGEMIARALRELTGADSTGTAWKMLLGNCTTLGLKPNCLAGMGVSSSPQFVHALARQITDSAPSVKKIIIWERSGVDLTRAGFELADTGRVECLGNDRAGYGRELVLEGSIGSLVSNVVLTRADKLINLPVLKDHGIVGVSVGLKNLYGAVHNPNKYHLNRGDPYVADLNRLPAIREKTVLTLCEAFTAQYEGGPPFKPRWSWPAGLVIASTDPVAIDRVGWELIEKKRAEHGMPSLKAAGREPGYIFTAADSEHRLGVADLSAIHKLELN